MKTIQHQAAQGDLLLRRVDEIPAEAEVVPPDQGRVVVAHSETGHDHYLAPEGVALLRVSGDPLVAYLRIDAPWADVIHARPWDTHETIRLPHGTYEVRRQREYVPGGWRRVED